MNTIDLYKLPKDILVKLISTIQEDLMGELEFKEEILEKVQTYDDVDITYCAYEGCKNYSIYWKSGKYFEKNKNLRHCDCNKNGCECWKNFCEDVNWWCVEHFSHAKLKHYLVGLSICDIFYCRKCFNHMRGEYCNCDGEVDHMGTCPVWEDMSLCKGCDKCNKV